MKKEAEQIYLISLYIIVIGLFVSTALGYAGNSHYTLDLISHFKLHFLILSFITLIPLFLKKNRTLIALVILSILLNLFEVAPWYIKNASADENIKYSKIKLITSNVRFNNSEYDLLLGLVENENPDIIFLQELNQKWINAIEPLSKSYPYSFIEDPENEFGIAIFSKTLLTEKKSLNAGKLKTPSLIANTKINGKTIQLISIHPNPPISKELFESRNITLKKLTETTLINQNSIVMGGDFNTTMWSPAYKTLIKNSGLKNTRKGFGMQGTWPIGKANYKNFINIKNGEKKGTDLIPRWVIEKHPIKLPIDHVLVSPEIVVGNFTKGPNINSDHLPIVVELLIPKK